MKEYDNFYEREDIYFMGLDPLRNYKIQQVILEARANYPNEPKKQLEIVRKECEHYWPIDDDTPRDIIEFVGLQNRTKEAMQNIYKEYKIQIEGSPFINCLVRAFYYQEKQWFYWWELYNNSELIRTGLEFFPWCDIPASYVIFATDQTQSPLMCGREFIHVRQY